MYITQQNEARQARKKDFTKLEREIADLDKEINGYQKGLERCRDDDTKQKIQEGNARLQTLINKRQVEEENINRANAEASRARAQLADINSKRSQMMEEMNAEKVRAFNTHNGLQWSPSVRTTSSKMDCSYTKKIWIVLIARTF